MALWEWLIGVFRGRKKPSNEAVLREFMGTGCNHKWKTIVDRVIQVDGKKKHDMEELCEKCGKQRGRQRLFETNYR